MRWVRRLGVAGAVVAVLVALGVIRITTPWTDRGEPGPSNMLAGGHPRSWVHAQLIGDLEYPALLPTTLPDGSDNRSEGFYFLQPISTEYLGARRHRDRFWRLPYWVLFEEGAVWDTFEVVQYPEGTKPLSPPCWGQEPLRSELVGGQRLVVCGQMATDERTLDYLRTVEFSSDLDQVTWLPD
jgi:hypothetical protein